MMKDKFDELLKNFNLEFFGKGRHKISVDKALELQRREEAVIVDVRTKEEVEHVRFDFALHIPVQEIPQRKKEIPQDKTVIVFCSSIVRAAIVYTYLRVHDHEQVKILTAGLPEIVSYLKPGYVLKVKTEGK